MSDNLAIFIGNVGQDAEVKEVGKDNNLVMNFSVAVKTGYGDRAVTHWVQCAMWGDRVEKLQQYITKGTKVVVKGEVSPEAYENKDNKIVATIKLNVNDLSFAGNANKNEGGGGRQRRSSSDDGGGGRRRSSNSERSRPDPEDDGMGNDDDIPFD
jgi:single-strand DNA-binding protein